ncbi:MAG: tetratricopeptide repeat protein [Pseudomonadota bacterium]
MAERTRTSNWFSCVQSICLTVILLNVSHATAAADPSSSPSVLDSIQSALVAGNLGSAEALSNDCLVNTALSPIHADCAIALAKVHVFLSRFPQAVQTLEEHVSSSLPRHVVQTNQIRGVAYLKQGNYAGAIDNFESALKTLQDHPDQSTEIKVLNNLGVSLLYLEDYQSALEAFERLHRDYESEMSPTTRASVLSNIGDARHLLGDNDEALDWHKKALVIRESVGNPEKLGISYRAISQIYTELDDLPLALDYSQRAIDIESQHGMEAALASTLIGQAEIRRRMGQLEEALDAAETSLEITDRLSLEALSVSTLQHLSWIQRDLGNDAAALRNLQRAFERQVSLHNEAERVRISQIEADYRVAKIAREQAAERQIAAAELAERDAQLSRLALIMAGVGAVLLAVIVFSQYVRTKNHQLRQANQELTQAYSRIDTLEGFLTLCMHCRKIWIDDEQQWVILEEYVQKKTKAQTSHGLCKECRDLHYPTLAGMDE